MKKYLTIGFILWLGIAGKVYASSPASWYASSTPQAISPTAINGVQPKLLIPQLSSTGSPCLNVSTSGLIATTTCATTSPAGSSGQLQYNNGGVFGATSSPVVGYITATSTTATSTFNGAISVPKLKWGGMFSNQYPLTEDANGNVSLFSNLYLDTGFSTPGVHIPSALYVNSVATNYISSNSMGLNISGSGYGIQANDFLHANDNLTVTGTTTSPCFSNNGTTCITGGGGSIATNPLQATYFTATSSTATSTPSLLAYASAAQKA